MANTDKNIVIIPNTGDANNPNIVFSGANASVANQDVQLTVLPDGNGTILFSASSGNLIKIQNSQTESLVATSANITGNLTASYLFGNGSQLTGVVASTANSLANGTSNVSIPAAGGNVNTSVGGTANVLVVTTTGINVAGTLNATGNANTGNIGATNGVFTNISGTLTGSLANGNSNVSIPAANGNVTISAAGNLNILTVTGTGVNVFGTLNTGTGNANVGNLGTTGNITANFYSGNGSLLTGIVATTASSLANGTSNVSIPAASGNVNTSVGGTANVLVVTSTGVNVAGTINSTGNTTVQGTFITQSILSSNSTGGAFTITTPAATSANTSGGNITLTTGTGLGTGSGGQFIVNGGTAPSTGFGGNIRLFAGAAATGGTGGSGRFGGGQGNTGGEIYIYGGNGTTNASFGNAGQVRIEGGTTYNGSLYGAFLKLSGGLSSASANNAGFIYMNAGTVNPGLPATGANGGNLELYAGDHYVSSANSGNGGTTTIAGGLGYNGFAGAGKIVLYGGYNAGGRVQGGDITIISGNTLAPLGAGTNLPGSNVVIGAGSGTGSGQSGNIILQTASILASGNANQTISNRVVIDSTTVNIVTSTNSTSTITGALVVAGGVGITGNLYAGGIANITGNANVGNLGSGNIFATGNVAAGISNPQANLHVANKAIIEGSAGVAILQIQKTGNTDNNIWQLKTFDTTGTLRLQALNDANTGGGSVLDFYRANNQITGASLTTNSTIDALRITQLGAGNAIKVEDVTNPDASPFLVDAAGNVGIGNVAPTDKLSIDGAAYLTGNVTANYYIGNGSLLTGITASAGTSITNGTSNVSIPASGGNVNTSVGGTANVLVVTSTGINVAGTLNTGTGNATVGNLIGVHANGNSNVNIATAGGNVTVGVAGNAAILTVTGTGVNVFGTLNTGTGNANVGNLGTAGLITATGNVSGGNLLTAANIRTSNTTGGPLYIFGSTGTTGNVIGGLIQIQAGEGFGTGASGNTRGGAVNIYAGNGVASSGSGGNINIRAGNNNADGGGIVRINAGDGNSSGTSGGALYIQSGNGVSSNNGGGGNINIQAGNGSISPGGTILIQAGKMESDAGPYIILYGTTTGNVGDQLELSAGDGGGTNNIGGNTIIYAGYATGNATPGQIKFWTSNGTGASGTTKQSGVQRATISYTGLNVNAATNSTSTTTGALIVGGGVGISGNLYAGGIANITGNANVGNLGTTGNITAGYFFGNGSQLTGITATTASALANGTSNVSIPASDGNINMSVGGTPNILTVTSNGVVMTASTTSDAVLRITQTGTGNSFIVEDSTNPDATPFAIDLNGRVIVGYGTYINSLDKVGVVDGRMSWYTYANNAAVYTLDVNKSRSDTANTQAIVQNGDNVLQLRGLGSDGNTFAAAGSLLVEVDGIPTANSGSVPGKLSLRTTGNGNTTETSRLIILNTGNVGIANTAPTHTLSVTGTLNVSGNANTGNIGANNGVFTNPNTALQLTGAINSTSGNYGLLHIGGIAGTSGFANLVSAIAQNANGVINTVVENISANVNAGIVHTMSLNNGQISTDQFETFLDTAGTYLTATKNLDIYSSTQSAGNLRLIAGNSNVRMASNGNVVISSAGNTGIVTVTGSGVNVFGTLNTGTGNATVGNLLGIFANGTSNVRMPTAGGNINMSVGGTSNILVVTSTGANITGTFNVSGNANVGNLGTAGLITATGNVTGNYFIGNGSLLTGISAGGASISNGTSNVNIATSGGNVTVGVGGTANVATFTTSNVIIGTGSSGNITGANVISATTLQGFILPTAGTTATAPIDFTAGSLLSAAVAGTFEYDGNAIYNTDNTTSGRGVTQPTQMYRYTTAGSALGPTIADYFPATSSLNLEATSIYEVEAFLYFLKTTAGTATFTWLFSSGVNIARSYYVGSPATGFTTTTVTGAAVTGSAIAQGGAVTTLAHVATASLTTAVYHAYHFKVMVYTNAATNLRIRITSSAGTVTPQAGSYYFVRKLPVNAGIFAA